MAKRLTDANKWDDPWYSDLSDTHKLAWDYICDKCDAVGVWKPSAKLLQFNTKVSDLVEFFKVCGPERIYVMPNGNWWLVKFCDFQYGELKEDSKSPTTKAYIKMLKKHSLWIGYSKGRHTPKDKDKDKDKDKEKDKDVLPTDDRFEVYGNGDVFVSVRTKYANEKPEKIFELDKYFEIKGQIKALRMAGLIAFKEFIKNNPGRSFNDTDHLYSSFKKFCLEGAVVKFVPGAKNKASPFAEAEFNRTLWTDTAWKDTYNNQIQNNPDFRKHFNL
jgi:hypothetical protein